MTHGIQRLDLSEALALLEEILPPTTEQEVRVLADARQAINATNILAPVSLPPFRSSAMDGYAARTADLIVGQHLPVVGISAAGHPYTGSVPTGSCIRILTGAVVPDVTDSVVIQEDVSNQGTHPNLPNLPQDIQINEAPTAGANVRDIGHDVAVGSPLVKAGQQLNAFELAWLAACGVPQVAVLRPIRVGILATGDELQPPGATLAAGQIFDSNRLLVMELLRQLPVQIVDLGLIKDDREAIRQAIADAAPDLDAIISTGGVSVGDADYITEVVESLGELDFWRLNLKPGKPMAVGRIHSPTDKPKATTWFFGLPGNPVSCAVTCFLIAMPALRLLAGQSAQAPTTIAAQLTQNVRHRAGRQEYLRGLLISEPHTTQTQASNWVSPTGDQSSNRLGSFQQANCLISIPKDAGDLAEGTWVEVVPLPAMV